MTAYMAAEKITLLAILGALNWAQTWYRLGGDPPAVLARRFLALLRNGSGAARP